MMEWRELGGAADAELVGIVRDGGPRADAAAGELFGRYRGRVYAWCRRYVRDPDQALDLAQDVLLTAYRGLGTWEGRAPFGGWLFTVAHHACLRAVRSRPPASGDDSLLEGLPDPRPDAATALEDAQQREALLDLVHQLGPLEQRAVWLRCAERMPVEEITRVLGLDTASGARGLLQTARRKLRAARQKLETDAPSDPASRNDRQGDPSQEGS